MSQRRLTPSGRCRWILAPTLPSLEHKDGWPGVLEITLPRGPSCYVVRPVGIWQGERFVLQGWSLEKPKAAVYHVSAETFLCDCPDATYRQRRCKHSLALQAALLAAGLAPLSTPTPSAGTLARHHPDEFAHLNGAGDGPDPAA